MLDYNARFAQNFFRAIGMGKVSTYYFCRVIIPYKVAFYRMP